MSSLSQVVQLIVDHRAVLNLQNRGFAVAQMVNQARDGDGVWRQLRQATITNEPVYEDDDDLDTVTTVTIETNAMYLGTVSARKCDSVSVPLGVKFYRALMLSPSAASTHLAAINRALTMHAQLINMILEQHTEKKEAEYVFCRHDRFRERSRRVGEPIDVWRMGQAFVVLAYGLLLCSVMFVMETVANAVRTRVLIA